MNQFPLSQKAIDNMNAYLSSDHCKEMDKLWADRYKNRCGVYSDCLNITVLQDLGAKLTPIK